MKDMLEFLDYLKYQKTYSDYTITREQIDRQIDELTSSSPKRFLKRLLRPFNKK